MCLDNVKSSIEANGLNFESILHQQKLIKAALSRGTAPRFKILDTCRFDNGGLLRLSKIVSEADAHPGRGFAAFVPAAGAASRYYAPLTPLIKALEHNDLAELNRSIQDLVKSGARTWPLPPRTKVLLESSTPIKSLSESDSHALLHELSRPKALMPCVLEGHSFLQIKLLEHQQLVGLEAQVFVTPPGLKHEFEHVCEQALKQLDTPPPAISYLEQGPELSTIRFRRDGDPLRESDGGISIVPAGHGALASLFSQVRQTVPTADAVFIRNIDNINGTGQVAADITARFLTAQRKIFTGFQLIREALKRDDLASAAAIASHLQQSLSPKESGTNVVNPHLEQLITQEERQLWDLLLATLHTPPPAKLTRTMLEQLYSRPVNLLGQVPNTSKDIGGTPCFVASPRGSVKVCLEVPHASEDDKRNFLANPHRATHFNPVFVAAEIPSEARYYAHANDDFWLLSEKIYRGEPVVYYETVLYELLGNSFLANVIFVEVPRDVFHPHKVLADAAGRSVKDWTRSAFRETVN